MSSGRKSISTYYSKVAPKTILTCTIFCSRQIALGKHRHDFVMRGLVATRHHSVCSRTISHEENEGPASALTKPEPRLLRSTCAGTDPAAVRRVELRRPDARPCDGKSTGLFPGHTATFRS